MRISAPATEPTMTAVRSIFDNADAAIVVVFVESEPWSRGVVNVDVDPDADVVAIISARDSDSSGDNDAWVVVVVVVVVVIVELGVNEGIIGVVPDEEEETSRQLASGPSWTAKNVLGINTVLLNSLVALPLSTY